MEIRRDRETKVKRKKEEEEDYRLKWEVDSNKKNCVDRKDTE